MSTNPYLQQAKDILQYHENWKGLPLERPLHRFADVDGFICVGSTWQEEFERLGEVL